MIELSIDFDSSVEIFQLFDIVIVLCRPFQPMVFSTLRQRRIKRNMTSVLTPNTQVMRVHVRAADECIKMVLSIDMFASIYMHDIQLLAFINVYRTRVLLAGVASARHCNQPPS